jgi:hypothetical protein
VSGADEVFALAHRFEKASAEVARALFDTFKQEGETFAEDWADNARATSGEHGKWYPDSITSEAKLSMGILIETGPESGRKQGGMGEGFELGSRNQPPHFDGLQAMGPAEQRLERAADATIGFLLP